MTTPRDDIAGLSERLKSRAAGTGYGGGDPLCAEAAAQLDALSARVKELEVQLESYASLAMKEGGMRTVWQARALRAEARSRRGV